MSKSTSVRDAENRKVQVLSQKMADSMAVPIGYSNPTSYPVIHIHH